MNRDKQIEEMAKDIACLTAWDEDEIPTINCLETAKRLYLKGYRKASEVAREIFEEIEKIKQDSHCEDCLGEWHEEGIFFGGIEELKKKYTEGEGVIVPKVKIGDKLYAINASRARVNTFIVTHLEVYDCGVKIFGRPIYCRAEYWLCWSQDLGNHEWVYLTREEAEKALKERSKE